jgi:hypothetical protein
MSLTSGTRLGPYEIVSPLGAGGMGEVFRARDTRLGRDVAVKVLPQHLSANPEVRARFEREAKTVSSLNHPNICTLFDAGREGDTDYLVMELIEGETLAGERRHGNAPEGHPAHPRLDGVARAIGAESGVFASRSPAPHYPSRSAAIGSSCAMRTAGIRLAPTAATSSTAVTVTNTMGSRAD